MRNISLRLGPFLLVAVAVSGSCGSTSTERAAEPVATIPSASATPPSAQSPSLNAPTSVTSSTFPPTPTTVEPGSAPVGVYRYEIRTSVMLPEAQDDGTIGWEKLYHHQESVTVDPQNRVASVSSYPLPIISPERVEQVSRTVGVSLDEAQTSGTNLIMTDDGSYVQLEAITGIRTDWVLADWENEWASWDLRFRITDIAARFGAPVPVPEPGPYGHTVYRFDVDPIDAQAAMALFGPATSLISWRPGQVEVPHEATVDYYPDGQLNTVSFQSASGSHIEIFEITLRGTRYDPIEVPVGSPPIVAFSG